MRKLFLKLIENQPHAWVRQDNLFARACSWKKNQDPMDCVDKPLLEFTWGAFTFLHRHQVAHLDKSNVMDETITM